jgi:hypothetical protein
MNDVVVSKIFSWFDKNTKAGSQQINPMYTGVFYYDSCFWPVFVPIIYGTVKINACDALKTMPESIVKQLWKDRGELEQYVSVWADCIDYAFGFENLQETGTHGKFAQGLLKSGNQELNALVALLLERIPNSKSMESARMSTEMFLKTFLAAKDGLNENGAKNKIGHDLEKALNACLAVDPNSELKIICSSLKLFPRVEDRYKGIERTPKELWSTYAVAQFIGATVVRTLSGRDGQTIKGDWTKSRSLVQIISADH